MWRTIMRLNMKNQHGFSIIELLVAITILSFALLALAEMQSLAMKKTSISQKISVANSVAQVVMDDILSYDISNPKLNSSQTYNYVFDTTTNATTVSVAGAGIMSATVTTTVNTPTSGITWIIVTVTGTGIQPVTISSFKRVV
jgi:prepilin-type N-terminal cleavage/methylation domain-containing protein